MVSHALALLVAGAVTVPTVDETPAIDCRLDDRAWQQAVPLGAFHQTFPGDNAPAAQPTSVRVARTSRALLVAIEAAEEPGRARATLARRDAIGDDDTVTLYLDTFRDRRRAYVVMVNPLGVQQDGVVVEGREPDYSFDLLLQSAGCIGERGYTVELAIPFSSLRYEAGPGRSWGLHVIRQRRDDGEESSWMPLRRDRLAVAATTRQLRARFLEQAGALTGIQDLDHPRAVEVIPVASAARTSDDTTDAGLGLTARLTLASALAADVAINPDFAEVEADQPQSTANQRFPLFFAEKRPFFLEGADLLQTPIRAFHSRSIVDPDGALKLTGTRGRSSGTALLAMDAAPGPDKAWAGVVRGRRDVGSQSSVGLLATHHEHDGLDNDVLGVDARVPMGERSVWTVQGLVTRTDDRLGFAYFTEWARSDTRTSVQVVGEGYSPEYQARLGYTQRTDTNRWSATGRYNGRSDDSGALRSWSALHTLLLQFDHRGRAQYAYLYPRVLLTFPAQTFLNLCGYADYLRVFEAEFGPGAFAFGDERSTRYHGLMVEAGTAPSRLLSVSATFDRSWNNLDYDLGAGRFPRVSPGALRDPQAPLDPGPADSSLLAAAVAVQPTEALRVTASWEHGRLVRDDTGRTVYDQHLASLRAQYAFTRATWLRGRLDYDSLERRTFHQVLFGWTPRPGTALYLGWDRAGERPAETSTLFAKLSLAVRRPRSAN